MIKLHRVKVSNSTFTGIGHERFEFIAKNMIKEAGLKDGQEVDIAIMPQGFYREMETALLYLKQSAKDCEDQEDMTGKRLIELNIEKLKSILGIEEV